MGNLVLTRIDSRLIHGQVMTKWVNQVRANKIVVVSGIQVDCITEAAAIESYKADVFGQGNVLLLLPSLAALKNLYDGGVTVQSVQVGGLGGGPSRKVVFQNITLDDADAAIVEELAAKGVSIIFQTIPEDAPQDAATILKKYRG